MEVPDAIDPFVGWRAWNIISTNEGTFVGSINAGVLWPAGRKFEATCRYPHEPPDPKCSCGVYAARTRKHLQKMSYHFFDLDEGRLVIIGEVYLWGGVVPGTQGWRAQFGYPKNFQVPYSLWKYATMLRQTYAVPTVLNNTFK